MLNLFFFFVFSFLLYPVIVSQYAIAQSYHYEISKYFKYQFKIKIIVSVICLIIYTISFFVNGIVKILLLFLQMAIIYIFLFRIIPFKLTNRVKRFFLCVFSINSLIYFLPFNKLDLLLCLETFILFFIFMSHLLSSFIEFNIINYYASQAKEIIKDVKIIGITGSYGKTSCKNIIFDMLEGTFNVSKTPKSYNNKVGIVKSIRECVNEGDDYFICEYGVDKKAAMDKLIDIARPNVALISEIGPQHLLTFKSIENIKNEKLKLVKCLNENEWAIINNDNQYLNEEIQYLKCNVLTYGIKNNSRVMAKDIKMTCNGSSFDLYVDDKFISTIKISLLGEHNILNVLGAISVLITLNIDLKDIKKLTLRIKPTEHRLQLKKMENIKVIDDSFNSNEVGFKNAIDVLALMKEEKIVITPGIIEQGDNSAYVNYKLGRYMASKVDKVILVEKNASIIEKGLLVENFKKDKIIIKKNFAEAWEYVKETSDDEKIYLIENDLPSIYLK